jgi:predicted nucleic acid-binding protein
MRVLFDTSVLVAALLGSHPSHPQAISWLKRAKSGEIEFLVSTHTLAELYSVLSSLPVKPRIDPATAWRLINENVEAAAQPVSLTPEDYLQTIRRVAALGISGGVIYDAIIARAAEKSDADKLLTLNGSHFERVWPEGRSRISAP